MSIVNINSGKTTLIGIVTFGNLPFTKLAIESIEETVTKPYELFLVVGKPGDTATKNWLTEKRISHIVHEKNMGFPSSVNDIYDYAWKRNNFDNLVLMGNDVVALPYAIDSLINASNTTDNIWISAEEVDVRTYCYWKPEMKKYFQGANYIFKDYNARPWKEFPLDLSPDFEISPDISLKDCHNLSIFKREIFDILGYIDVNFYPAYFEDNDFVRRALLEGTIQERSKFLQGTRYFHFWSRTIKQETGGSTHIFFKNNRAYYIKKWGGEPGAERYALPFNGVPHALGQDIVLDPVINITSREQEDAIVDYWLRK